LPKEIRETFDAKLSLFLSNPHHPSIRVKRLVGTTDRWEGSLTINCRFTFQFSEGWVLFRRIGTHDILRIEG